MRFCLGEVDVEGFEKEFVAASQPAKDRPSSAEGSIAYEVELALAEFGRGHWNEDELRQELLRLVRTLKLTPTDSRSANETIRGSMTYQESSTRTRPVGASA